MSTASPVTTHVLDLTQGRPAPGVAVVLEQQDDGGLWQTVGEGFTDDDGRIADLLSPAAFSNGCYRITFATGDYFQRQDEPSFYPSVTIEFQVTAADQHYHVPLLLSPFGYSTYRGS